MTEKLPDLTPHLDKVLPPKVQELTAARTFRDLHIWQTEEENQRWDAPFDEATELLKIDPEACFDQCMLALDAISVEFPVITEFFTTLRRYNMIEFVDRVPLYCENLAARLIVSRYATFVPNKPFVKIPDIAVRGRLWLANQCTLGAFPQLDDPMRLAYQLAGEAGVMAPADPDAMAMLAIILWMADAPVKDQLEALADVFEASFNNEQVSYAYYVAALLRSGTPDALACYQQVAPGTAFYENALAEAVALRAELEVSNPGYVVPDYSDPSEIFNFMNGSRDVPHPVDPKFLDKSLHLIDDIHLAVARAGLGDALEDFRTYDRIYK